MTDLIKNTFSDTTNLKGYTSFQKCNIIHILLNLKIYHNIPEYGKICKYDLVKYKEYIEKESYSNLCENYPQNFTKRIPSPATILRILKEFKYFLNENKCSADDICSDFYNTLKLKETPSVIVLNKTEEDEIDILNSKYCKDLELIKSKYIEIRSSEFLKNMSESLEKGISKDVCHVAIFNLKEYLNL